jgi:hypothetical protein
VPTIQAVDIIQDIGWIPVRGLSFSDQEWVDLMMYNSHDRGCAFHIVSNAGEIAANFCLDDGGAHCIGSDQP